MPCLRRSALALRDLGQERPYLRGLHRYTRIVQQTIKLVEFPGVVSVRHASLSSRVNDAMKLHNMAVLRQRYAFGVFDVRLLPAARSH